MANFCKKVMCPSSQQLLNFENGESRAGDAAMIRRHLIKCEFCAAEVEFYSHFPQADEAIETADIPKPLFELAEALLSNRHKDFSLLNKLLSENEGITLETV